jgi:hypothetical protein
MPGKQQIEFIIRPDGSVEEHVTGVEGLACEQVTGDIERALGSVAEREHTQDYYKQPQGSSDTVETKS